MENGHAFSISNVMEFSRSDNNELFLDANNNSNLRSAHQALPISHYLTKCQDHLFHIIIGITETKLRGNVSVTNIEIDEYEF